MAWRHGAYRFLRDELRAELKATSHPYLTDDDRVARYLTARGEQEKAA